MKRLAIVITHPIQYYAPLFRLMTERQRIGVRVFYTWDDASITRHDPGFGKIITWDVDLLSGYDYQSLKNTAVKPGSHHFNGVINPDIIEQINAFKPDAVLAFSWAYNAHLTTLRHFKGKIPVFFRADSNLLDQRNIFKRVARSLWLTWVYRHIDHAFYTGINNRAYFKKYGLKDAQLSFAPHAVDNDWFSKNRLHEAALLKKQMDIPETDTVILFAGKMEDKKHPTLLLNAFLKLNKPLTHLLFVGDGHLKDHLKTLAGASPNVHFLDFQNQSYMPVVYQACNLFCLPSQGPGETWGLAVNEAMACGKAILVSDKVGCAADLVQPGKNGMIFKSDNEADLLNCLDKLTASKDLLLSYGRESANIIKPWCFENIVKAIENRMIDARP